MTFSLGRKTPDLPVSRSVGGVTALASQSSDYAIAAPRPGQVPDLRTLPNVRLRPTMGEYWNAPLGDSGMTRADHLRQIGAKLRDPKDGVPPFDSWPDNSPPQQGGLSRGGGVGGVGGVGPRKGARGSS